MSTPRPESRLNELESQMSLHGARIRELSDDTAESLRDLKQDIKHLSESIEASYKGIGDFFVLLDKDVEMIKATMATKEDLAALKTAQDQRFDKLEQTQDQRFDKLEQTQDQRFDKLEQTQDQHSKKFDEHSKKLDEHSDMLRQILQHLQQKPSK